MKRLGIVWLSLLALFLVGCREPEPVQPMCYPMCCQPCPPPCSRACQPACGTCVPACGSCAPVAVQQPYVPSAAQIGPAPVVQQPPALPPNNSPYSPQQQLPPRP
jgi:hypothetical protein